MLQEPHPEALPPGGAADRRRVPARLRARARGAVRHASSTASWPSSARRSSASRSSSRARSSGSEDIAQIRQRVRDAAAAPDRRADPGTGERPTRLQDGRMDTGEYVALARRRRGRGADRRATTRSCWAITTAGWSTPCARSTPELAPERVVLKPEVFPLRLEPREVEAYRRLFGQRRLRPRARAVPARGGGPADPHQRGGARDHRHPRRDLGHRRLGRLRPRPADLRAPPTPTSGASATCWTTLMLAGEHGRVPPGRSSCACA